MVSKKELAELTQRVEDLELVLQTRLEGMFKILPPHIERRIMEIHNQYYGDYARSNYSVDIREVVKLLLDFLNVEATIQPAKEAKLTLRPTDAKAERRITYGPNSND